MSHVKNNTLNENVNLWKKFMKVFRKVLNLETRDFRLACRLGISFIVHTARYGYECVLCRLMGYKKFHSVKRHPRDIYFGLCVWFRKHVQVPDIVVLETMMEVYFNVNVRVVNSRYDKDRNQTCLQKFRVLDRPLCGVGLDINHVYLVAFSLFYCYSD